MDRNKFIAVLDPSSIFWNKNDYKSNQHHYRDILTVFPELLSHIEKYPILISEELIDSMFLKFPYSELHGDFWAIGNEIFSFFQNIGGRAINYSKKNISALSSTPEQLKPYYDDQLKQEVNYLISYCHENPDSNRTYFSFKHFWNKTNVLATTTDSSKVEHSAVIADRDNSLDSFFGNLRLIFKHYKKKHDIDEHKNRAAWLISDNKDSFVSQLTCIKNNNAQSLLDNRYDQFFGNERYYSYDSNNDVYIVFRWTDKNIFHAHDEYNINKVPPKVRKHFRIFKYKWI